MRTFFLTFALVALFTVKAHALAVPDKPEGRVSDYANLLTPAQRSELTNQLAEVERSTTNQIVIAIFPSLDGENLDAFSMRLAEKWKIGQKDKDNGVIISVFVNDHKMRIEVGYGLEGTLPDVICKRIIDVEMTPRFRAQDYAAGLKAAVSRLGAMRAISLQEAIDSGMPRVFADYANLLDEHNRTDLENQLSENEKLTGIQIVCVLFPSLESRSLDNVPEEISRKWIEPDPRSESIIVIAGFVSERQASVILVDRLKSRFPADFIAIKVPAVVFDTAFPNDAYLMAAANQITFALMGDYDYDQMAPKSWVREWQREAKWNRFASYAFYAFIIFIICSIVFGIIAIAVHELSGGGGSGSSGNWSSGGGGSSSRGGGSSGGGGSSSRGGGSFGGGGSSGSW